MTALESPLSNRMDDKFGLQSNGVSRLEAPTDEDILGSSIDCSAKLQRSGLTETEDPNGTISGDSNCTMSSECDITVIHVPGAHAANDRMITKDAEDDGGIPIAENDKKDYGLEGKDSKDGSDSGVEGCAVELPRVQSRNSVDYASSSCNGLDEASCDSSLVSCCSVYEDTCATLPDDPRLGQGLGALGGPPGGGEGTSEGGSESSSIAGSVSARVQKRANNNPSCAQAKKKIGGTHGLTETQRSGNQRSGKGVIPASGGATVNGTTSTGARAKPRATPQRNLPTKPQANNCRESSRGRSRDKSLAKEPRDGSGPRSGSRCASAARVTNGSVGSTVASRARARPDTLPSALTTEINKDLAQRSKATGGTRARGGTTNRTTATATTSTSTTSTSTGRTPGSTPSEDGRKPPPSTARNTASLCTSRVDPRSSRMLDKMSSSTEGSKTLDAYATLPRAPRHGRFTAPKTNEKPPVAGRSRSGSRDASLNRILGRKGVTNKEAISHKGLPPYPKYKVTEKTRIYHETSVQTGLTCKDIDNCLAGIATIIPNPESVEMSEKDSQTEGTWDDLQEMKENLKKTTSENEERKKDNEKLKIEVDELKKKLAEEQADHIFARQELDRNAQRVLAMLGTPQSEHAEASDSFLELESHFQSSGQVVANQQIEIADLQSLCRMLSRDLEKSLAAQKALLQQQQELEAESMEMQDFLQEEKTTLEIALKEAEIELKKKDENGKQLSSELERQTEECKHLVRISEQRRQENLSLCMKLNAVERRSKDLLLAQGAASSGASVALSGLGNRLEGLIDQLIMSYNISEKDFEDVVYHNEAYSRSNSSVESSPVSSKHSLKDCTPSPKRGSFVSAVIGAIKNAANHPFTTKQTNEKKFNDSSKLMRKDLSTESSSDILDFETEPCLMMESVLEDVPLTDTYSHNMVSSCDSLRRVLSVPETVDEFNFKNMKAKGESSSLTNLTQAILNRRKVEDEEEENCESISESETGPSESLLALGDYCQASLVDQVIDVDNLVTKLLKVLRIIQLDNDTCIQELKDDKLELETRLEIFLAERKTVVNSQDCETKISSNGVNSQTSIIENCIHVIKGINNAKELIIGGQIERKKCILNEYQDDDHNANAAVLFS